MALLLLGRAAARQAAKAGCAATISEDMADGAALGSIRVVPAFAGDGVNPVARALL